MCGIAGVIGLVDGHDPVTRMVEALRHRGPDDQGVVEVANAVWLGNRRLAILDLSPAGHMPMEEPGTGSWITYNGEVYNFGELRRELEAGGWQFKSRTDTEVVLAAWIMLGKEALPRLRGMFALAIYDARRGEVILARDPLGEKPLYYSHGPGWFAFASEVRGLLSSGLVSRRLDPRTLGVYLHNGFCVDPLTLVEGVQSLLPGHLLRVGRGGRVLAIERFWHGPFAKESEFIAGAQESLRARVKEVVHMRLLADVPVGAFLSGGLDSTVVVGAMVRAAESTRTLTVALPGSPLDESRRARRSAQEFGTDHYELVVGAELRSWLQDSLNAFDQPSFDGVNSYLVARAARAAGLTVALSGLGGDELFGGYPFLRHAQLIVGLLAALGPARTPLRGARRLARLSGPGKLLATLQARDRHFLPLAGYQATQALFPPPHGERMQQEPAQEVLFGLPIEFVRFLESESAPRPLLDRICHFALRLFCGQRVLRDTDAVSMAVSLEVRLPFLDRVLVEEAFSLPAAVRCRGIPNKPFEYELLRPLTPPKYRPQGKQGFTLPFREWLGSGGALHDFALQRLADRSLVTRAGLRPDALERLVRHVDRLPWSRVWALVALLDWVARTGVEV